MTDTATKPTKQEADAAWRQAVKDGLTEQRAVEFGKQAARSKRAPKKAVVPDDGLTPEERVERDAARYEALAREHGADLSEDGFNATLKKVGRRTPEPSE